MFRQNFTDECNSRTNLARESDTGNKPQRGILRHGVNECVQDVPDGIKQDRAKHDARTSLLVSENTPDKTTDQQTALLTVNQIGTGIGDLARRETQVLEACDAEI